jgi:hypothetical protein
VVSAGGAVRGRQPARGDDVGARPPGAVEDCGSVRTASWVTTGC